MQKIVPYLWFDDQAEEAMDFYTSLFEDSSIGQVSRYGEGGPRPAGQVITGTFQLAGQDFMALNGGPQFKFTPAISFFVSCDTREEIDRLWSRLSEGGAVLMELGSYPFSQKFGWLNDRYGLSWQLNLAGSVQKITPYFLFVGNQHGRAEEAVNHYISLFPDSSLITLERFGAGEGETEGTVKHARFTLAGQQFIAMESGLDHQFTFNEAISLFVNCQTQAEVDDLWARLTADGGEESMCGWLKDKFGVSWQIIPTVLGELLNDPDPVKANRVMQAMLQMRKIDIAGLQRAYQQG